MDESTQQKTDVVGATDASTVRAPRLALRVVAGPDTGQSIEIALDPVSVGSHPSCGLRLSDRSVSRFHFEIAPAQNGLLLKDLGSTNGTFVAGMRVREVFVGPGAVIRAGLSAVDVSVIGTSAELPLFPDARLGALVGATVPMKRLFATIVRLAPRDVPVLIQGETGTGKEVVAREIHANSARAAGPFVVVDCGAIPPELAESDLFGHVKGAFTGATTDRRGSIEAADGGTLFLDEIGELELSLQSRLLRAVEAKQVKRVGGDSYRSVDARVIAATHRDLRVAVNEGLFREDLYYRLAVATLFVPPLRDRPDDIPLLLEHFYAESARALGLPEDIPRISPETSARLRSLPWRGNCRELRNFVERSLALSGDLRASAYADIVAQPEQASLGAGGPTVRTDLTYKDSKALWVEHFERVFVAHRLREASGNVSQAARDMEIDRAYLLRLLKRHGIR